jgi:cell surface protein SprA
VKHRHSKITTLLLLLSIYSLIAGHGLYLEAAAQQRKDSKTQPKDSTVRYSVRKTAPQTLEELRKKLIDFKDPENLKTQVYYDEKNNVYIVGTKIGKRFISTPLTLTPEEYAQWSLKQSLRKYYQDKTAEAFHQKKDKFSFTDMKFDLGPAEKIFGPGGVQIKTQGSAELSFGGNMKNVDNPSLPTKNRKTFGFDFDEKININVKGKVGDKVNMNLNYNTDATFDFDTKKIKLRYEGKEDEIIKLLEGGNISMPSNSSLIRGASSLFGIRADLQFGKLKIQTVVSQQESESKTVTSKGGAQTTDFEIKVDNYDENRHFFLSQYFRDTYDKNMEQLPTITSGITINRIEVWVTNKKGSYNNPRNIVALADLGEHSHISNPQWSPSGVEDLPYNNTNTLYNAMVNSYTNARYIDQVNNVMNSIPGMEGGTAYEKIENARLLSANEYYLNKNLGYLSLRQTLHPDEVLAVAFEYTKNGKSYQVGEFAADIKDTNTSLYLKLLKSTANTPTSPTWDLMMKNIYSLNAYQIQKDKFRLDIKYQSEAGVYINYIPEGKINKKILLRVMNLDRLDNNNQRNPNGYFDFVPGYTIQTQNGRVIFPVVEPFGSHLLKQFDDPAIAQKYVYQALYDSTKTVAKQSAEKNKFILQGEYRASSGSEINLGAMNVPVGSVKVTAGGVTLTENSDYTVDYTMGVVTILNQSIIDAGTPIQVNLENNSNFSLQRKTMLGFNFTYDFNKDFQIGGTLMHLSEKPLTNKVTMGDEPISNTIWGLNTSWKTQSQWLTNMIDKLPFLEASKPSNIALTAEFAQLIPGHASNIQDDASYLDDFESTKTGIDIRQPSYWMLSSTPYNTASDALFPEAKLQNDIRYGENRALLSWYFIDPLFTRKNSSLTPGHLKSDVDQLSNHYVRQVYERELFPNKEATYGQAATLSVLNMAYYPDERGPYNLDPDLTSEGKLNHPEKRWAGMTRKINSSDFETANIEYIEFWMMDPFLYNDTDYNEGGDFYINLGDISEDILKDGKKFFENGMPLDNNSSKTETTAWGKVPTERSIVYAFDTEAGARQKQDVGLNGLNSSQEKEFTTYQNYLTQIQGKLDATSYQKIENDPAGDDYHFYRGTDYDNQQLSILERYKRFTMPEGNSVASNQSPERYDISAKTVPDVEDINQDFTLNENEKYFQYHISMRPGDLRVGENYITDKRTASVKLRNGKTEDVNWYLFKVPVRAGKSIGGIKDIKSIRFMRMFLTHFKKPIVLRFATLELVRGEWRNYTQALINTQQNVYTQSGEVDLSAVSIEKNSDKEPVNYVLPPGISRIIDPSQPQLRQQNEQALSMKVENLAAGDARAAYKGTQLDLRQYKRLQMFVHAERLISDVTNLQDNEMSVFIRIGNDYKNNYYEYEIPLKLTPAGTYDGYTPEGCSAVWPIENMLNIPLKVFTQLKKERNIARGKSGSGVSNNKRYYNYDPEKPANKISIIGNPSLAEIETIMVGVRNNASTPKSAEIWINELRLTEFNEQGGWAAQGNLNVQLSDLGSVNMTGHVETAGFGGLEQGVSERRMDDYYQYSITTNFELGRFFPTKAKVSAPLYFSYSKELTSPKYNPVDKDMLLDDALDAAANEHERDSIKNIAQEYTTYKNFSLSNVRVGIESKNPMPYDPANFTFSYSYTQRYKQGNTTAWESDENWKANFSYKYAPMIDPWRPFKKIKRNKKWLRILRDFELNLVPQNISFNANVSRHYYELQLRDLNNPYGDSQLPLSFSQEFLFNRDFSLRWDLTKNLKLSFTSATKAEVEEPYGPVNKDLYPDEYEAWKDSVRTSLLHLGKPLDYKQTFSANYQVPIDKIPLFDWIKANTKYASSYSWTRGSTLSDGTSMGNTIANQRSFDVNSRFNLEKLYNKVPFLKATNKKFARSSRRSTARNSRTSKNKKKIKRRYEKEIQLNPEKTTTVTHRLKTKRVIITAINNKGTRYPLEYKIKDQNRILVQNKDTAKVKIKIVAKPRLEDKLSYKIAQHIARFAMSVRSINVTYKNTRAMNLPGFLPNVGDVFGQQKNNGIFAPGLDFAFGTNGDEYLQKAAEQGWLLQNENFTSPATTNATENLQIRMKLEPLRHFKIDINASHTTNHSKSIQFMFDGMPTTRHGSMNMTVISLGSALENPNANNRYASATFDKFVQNLDIIQKRVEAQYIGSTYPAGSQWAGQTFDPAKGTLSKYSPDVMIPAFFATYTGGNIHQSSLGFFPKLLSLMPNWKITYSGLSKLSFFKKYFKSITLTHGYKSVYAIGSYNTFQTFQSYMGDLGFIEDVQTSQPVPSSRYDISSVSINEQFSPLIGINVTTKNNLTAKFEIKRTRILNLSVPAVQIVETRSNDLSMTVGYKLKNLKLFGDGGSSRGRKGKGSKKRKAVNNDLNLRANFTIKNQSALSRNIQQLVTQATSGNKAIKFSLSADYVFSRMLTMRFYFDKQKNTPLVSSSAYPVTTTDFGFTLKFSLNR